MPDNPIEILAANVAGLRLETDLLKLIVANQGDIILQLMASQALLGEEDSRQAALAKVLGGLRQDIRNGYRARMNRLEDEIRRDDEGLPPPEQGG